MDKSGNKNIVQKTETISNHSNNESDNSNKKITICLNPACKLNGLRHDSAERQRDLETIPERQVERMIVETSPNMPTARPRWTRNSRVRWSATCRTTKTMMTTLSTVESGSRRAIISAKMTTKMFLRNLPSGKMIRVTSRRSHESSACMRFHPSMSISAQNGLLKRLLLKTALAPLIAVGSKVCNVHIDLHFAAQCLLQTELQERLKKLIAHRSWRWWLSYRWWGWEIWQWWPWPWPWWNEKNW